MGQHVVVPPKASNMTDAEHQGHCETSLCHLVGSTVNALHIAKKHIPHIVERVILTVESMDRYHAAPQNAGIPEKVICATLGTGGEYAINTIGFAGLQSLWAAWGASVAVTGGAGVLSAVAVASVGAYAQTQIQKFGHMMGNAAQNTCHASFRLFDSNSSQSSSKENSLHRLLDVRTAPKLGKIIGTNIDLEKFNAVQLIPLSWKPAAPIIAAKTPIPAPKSVPAPSPQPSAQALQQKQELAEKARRQKEEHWVRETFISVLSPADTHPVDRDNTLYALLKYDCIKKVYEQLKSEYFTFYGYDRLSGYVPFYISDLINSRPQQRLEASRQTAQHSQSSQPVAHPLQNTNSQANRFFGPSQSSSSSISVKPLACPSGWSSGNYPGHCLAPTSFVKYGK